MTLGPYISYILGSTKILHRIRHKLFQTGFFVLDQYEISGSKYPKHGHLRNTETRPSTAQTFCLCGAANQKEVSLKGEMLKLLKATVVASGDNYTELK